MKTKSTTIVILIALAVLLIFAPLFMLPGAGFEGSDDAGSDLVADMTAGEYEPWFTPVMETLIGGELPGEIESLFFCVQTGIGVGILAYCFGYLVARKKYGDEQESQA